MPKRRADIDLRQGELLVTGHTSDMDIRLEVLQYAGSWVVTQSGPGMMPYQTRGAAIVGAIETATRHHAETGDRASVYLWTEGYEALVFDSAAPAGS
jgi:hypothetical protein